MRRWSIVLLSFLAVNAALSANPFLGRWKSDEMTVVATDTEMTVTDSGQDGIYPYTYDDKVLRVGGVAVLYLLDGDTLYVLTWGTRRPYFDRLLRVPAFAPHREVFRS